MSYHSTSYYLQQPHWPLLSTGGDDEGDFFVHDLSHPVPSKSTNFNGRSHDGPVYSSRHEEVSPISASSINDPWNRSSGQASAATIPRRNSSGSFVSDLTEDDFTGDSWSSVSELSSYTPWQSRATPAQPHVRSSEPTDGVYTAMHGTRYEHAPIVDVSTPQLGMWTMEDTPERIAEDSSQYSVGRKSNGVSKLFSRLVSRESGRMHQPGSIRDHLGRRYDDSYQGPRVLQNPVTNSVEYLSEDTVKPSLWKSARSVATACLSNIHLPSRYKPSSWSGSDIASDGASAKKRSKWQSAKSGATAHLKSIHLPKLYQPSSWSGSEYSRKPADDKKHWSGKLRKLWSREDTSRRSKSAFGSHTVRALSIPEGDRVGEDWFDESGRLTQQSTDEAMRWASRSSRSLHRDDFAPEDWFEEDGRLSEAIISHWRRSRFDDGLSYYA
ncbi:hypothetical protein L202_03532 [Cryptococcus amylolentus CBS 6039]|uniref:Uncharacterized protein n=1 Tax=Cryptococcus amylolentus CBS 6039 TaxID=1295533 RepID=A0A1E3HTW8_9TREE|nr:hypothetical protein L202_03532 [Cryptococcus amylolentus CBS 6039]ODN79585.1 hypothetical protein L202_03532 [Cryptococcus amylolentus CBS 6039]